MATALPALRVSESRLRRYYFGGERSVLVLAISALLGFVFLVAGAVFLKLEQRDSRSEVLIKARVTDKYRRSEAQKNADGETQLTYIYLLRYSYQDAAGKSHEGRETIDFADWDKLQKGDELTVAYEAADPEKSKPFFDRSGAGRGLAIFCLLAGTFLCAGTAVTGTAKWIAAYGRVRRICVGEPVAGEVIQRLTRSFPGFGDHAWYRLRYRFIDPSGVERTDKTPWLPRDVACRFAAGDPLVVLCTPGTQRHEADVFEVRVDHAP